MKYSIYTDGSAIGQNKKYDWNSSPVKGGWAFVIVDENDNIITRGSGGEIDTTNNRMELNAILMALKTAYSFDKEAEYTVYSDSSYCVTIINEYCYKWEQNKWKKKNGSIKNLDLIKPVFKAKDYLNYTMEWVKGHSDNKYNNLVDELAVEEAKNAKLVQ